MSKLGNFVDHFETIPVYILKEYRTLVKKKLNVSFLGKKKTKTNKKNATLCQTFAVFFYSSSFS